MGYFYNRPPRSAILVEGTKFRTNVHVRGAWLPSLRVLTSIVLEEYTEIIQECENCMQTLECCPNLTIYLVSAHALINEFFSLNMYSYSYNGGWHVQWLPN